MCRYSNTRQEIRYSWYVFKDLDEINETWEKIQTTTVNDDLQGCVLVTCSTMKYNPTMPGSGPSTTGVICVYIEEHNMDTIGFKLIEIVQQDIKYKTESDSLAGNMCTQVVEKLPSKRFSGTKANHLLYLRITHAMEHPDTRRIYDILMLLRLL